MNARLICVIAAVASIVVGGIVIGGMIVSLAELMYRTLAEAGSPGLAVAAFVLISCLAAALVTTMGYLALRRSVEWRRTRNVAPATTPEQMIAAELASLIGAQPTKLVVASLGIGFVLGLSPRLRRAVYRSFVA